MTLLNKVLHVILGDPNQKKIKQYYPIVAKINALEPSVKSLSDDDLRAKTLAFRQLLSEGARLNDILPEAFAVVREASIRTIGLRHFDVQLIGGMVLHEGQIAEMKTGEGKTLVSTLAAYLNALEGKGVYVVTVNDYLARRDRLWMGQIFEFLGLSVGLIQSGMMSDERRVAYGSDITYGTNNEFGFDYLRDNLAYDVNDVCQVRRHFAIVDEVDSILIDEARTPLIISGPVPDSTAKYKRVADVTRKLKQEAHFTVDEKHRNVVMLEDGIDELERLLGVDNIYSVANMEFAHMAVQCLKALWLFKRDVDYVVKDGEVLIVDEFTGRILDGRRYSDGLHQAIEAVEDLTIKEESQTLASITFQNYFRMFPKLAGMTGTAATEASEFAKIYGLNVVTVPSNKPMIRMDNADLVYKTRLEKYKAVVANIKELYEKKQPVLVGTISIETSELISNMLKRYNIPHSVLNAKFHEMEAEIVAKAGQAGMVTIATNMAGRGTDIVLGEGVPELGGLFVMGTERHESRRIDNQLRGRSGRQGDPGASRFYVSLEDDLMRLFASDRIAKIMNTLGMPDDMPIEHPLISKSIERAQSKVEQYNFSIRKQILQYDDVMNKQRETVYGLRFQILSNANRDQRIQEFIASILEKAWYSFFFEETEWTEQSDTDDFYTHLQQVFPIANLPEMVAGLKQKKDILAKLSQQFFSFYLYRQSQFPPEIFEAVVRQILLRSLDRKWMDHIHNMEVLREGIGLRAWGQKDPLMEYKIEAFEMFKGLLASVAEDALETINRFSIVTEEQAALPSQPSVSKLQFNHAEAQEPVRSNDASKTGRNDTCPCGSGRKYKKCCMK